MLDVHVKWNPLRQGCDWLVVGGGLDPTQSLETMVNLCLWTDRRADDGDVLPPGQTDPRGWWGDAYSGVKGDRIGSKLWLRYPGRSYPKLPLVIENDINEALQCLIDDGIVSSIDVQAWFPIGTRGRIDARVVLHRGSKGPVTLQFDSLWTEILSN